MTKPANDPRDPVRTEYWRKPGPTNKFDWSAVRDSYEPPMPVGYGATEQEAVADLLMLEDE